jgi:ribosomal protein S18 acetylase RimI-like enzyme
LTIDIATFPAAELVGDPAAVSVLHALRRWDFSPNELRGSTVFVAYGDGLAVGYAIAAVRFFDRGFVWMLAVDPAHRRRGVATALMRTAEVWCPSDRLFTSTNQSNAPARRLYESLGYLESGTVENLDPGDPEVFYCRLLGDDPG